MYDDIEYTVDGPAAIITLNRPDSMNGWTPTMDAEVRDAVSRSVADDAVVGIVVTGAGRAFCAGADMRGLDRLSSGEGGASSADDRPPRDPDPWETLDGDFSGRFPYLMQIDKPVIAAVNGAVAGMAYPLALCCDIRVATPKSLFVTAFAQRGLIAEWGLSWLLPRQVGPGAALDLLFTSRRLGGEEAYRIGLAQYLVEPDELLPFCVRYVEDIAERCSPASLAIMKRQVYEQLHRGLGEAELESQRLMVESFERPDFREGVRSFIEKREPEFPRIGAM